MELTEKEKGGAYDTLVHIQRVRNLINRVVGVLLKKGEEHDQSKLKAPEVLAFAEATPLHTLTFGSKEYLDSKAKLKVALDHHYANNPHHPQHFKNGIEDMGLLEVLEMLIDWKASSERHDDGNIRKSIETNANYYNISPQFVRIMENTLKDLV